MLKTAGGKTKSRIRPDWQDTAFWNAVLLTA
jgi:hypothetical protein